MIDEKFSRKEGRKEGRRESELVNKFQAGVGRQIIDRIDKKMYRIYERNRDQLSEVIDRSIGSLITVNKQLTSSLIW